ncbi:helix-turn-helix transcriptional regulator [Kitasatospora acidiphila]|uniref:Helix-turn-helix transcriptional regulator n=1 Tax=Kitasatospora acidiphila TaxID=2567942 RepID=A0A540W530_9ACTN|nr:helix-turn-helix transcriptional regulator [Kitasatospora acidiphila]
MRELRKQAELSQERLAERSGLTVRSIGDLERGRTRPRRSNVRRLITALGAEGDDATCLEQAAM